jgi:hypothetical protein
LVFLFSRRRDGDVVIPAKAGIQFFSPLHRRGFPTSRDSFIPALIPTWCGVIPAQAGIQNNQ